VPDRKKGEQLVLVTTDPELDRTRVSDVLKEAGVSELMTPRIIINVPELPVLGSGKTDYVTINRLAREKTGE